MRFICCILLLIPMLLYSQQTVEICNDTKYVKYSIQSDIAAEIEWYCDGRYYYGNEITIAWKHPGIYTITAIAISNNCSSIPQMYTVIVTECDELVYWVPNSFTPNGDEFNTKWGPVFKGPHDVEDFRLFVFNRWGEPIWESYDPAGYWDGNYNGCPVADGVYIWTIEFGLSSTANRKKLHGHVTILR